MSQIVDRGAPRHAAGARHAGAAHRRPLRGEHAPGAAPQTPRFSPVTAEEHRDNGGTGRHLVEAERRRFLTAAELACCLALMAAAVSIGHPGLAVVAVVWLAAQTSQYSRDAAGRGILSRRRTLVRGYLAVPPILLGAALMPGTHDPSTVIGALAALVGVSLAIRLLLGSGVATRRFGWDAPARIVLVGTPVQLRRAVADFDGTDGDLVGVCTAPLLVSSSSRDGYGVPVLGDLAQLPMVAQELRVDQVRVLPGGLLEADLEALAWNLERTDADLVVAINLPGVAPDRMTPTAVAGVGVVIHSRRASALVGRLRGALDRVLAAGLLVAIAPVLALTALLVRLDSAGPVFFRQVRVGLDGKSFTMIKFRTMFTDAELRREELASQNEHGDGVLFKMREDPRVTRVGRLLRMTSLDELPQLLNVVRGEMSLVGPRPALPAEVALYDRRARRRLVVRPGLTGLWQVSGRSNLTWDESVRVDLDYVDNWTVMRDLRILARTFLVVLRRDGAY